MLKTMWLGLFIALTWNLYAQTIRVHDPVMAKHGDT